MAYVTGVPHTVWIEDPRALMTAVDLIHTAQEERKKRGGG